MSPRTKKQDADEQPEASDADAPKKRRGRPRKNADETVDTSDGSATSSEGSEGGEAASAPKKRGRPRKKKADESSEAADAASIGEATASGEADASAGEDTAPRKEARRGRKKKRDAEEADTGGEDDGESGRSSDDADRRDEGDDAAASASERDEDEGSEGEDEPQGGSRRRSRRSRGNLRVNYRDLQAKILPELHLLAKEVGLDDYRAMEKDDLAVAILARLSESEGLKLVNGYLEISSDGYGFLQDSLLQNDTRKVIVSAGLIKQFRLRTGDFIMGKSRAPRKNERYGTLIRVEAVNGVDPFQASKRPRFDDLVPTFPEERIKLETTPNELSARVIDLLAPIGRGQRGLIVAPPKGGKTTLLKTIAHSVVTNETDVKVIVLLVDERPEEVTDFRESVDGVEVVASTFDEPPTNHIRVAEFVHERSRRIVEEGGNVVILLDSITRLARANNLVTPPTGRTLSGGLDSSALHWPKRFLGAARNIRGGGSLSILATALVETGSRMDDVIFEEFKGTGNMELHLSRRLEERRIFPAIDILKSGTRREDLLLDESSLAKMWLLRKVISDMDASEAMEMLLSRLSRTKTNEEFLSTLGQG
ncbi:MAG: transcription termination factor Rho [Trueperaceae bacterium]|nr:transcription termination factor Rho [Trueperaceae bacterium]